MRSITPLLALCLALPSGACRGPAAPAAPSPADVPPELLVSTVWIGLSTGRELSGYASAVVLGPRHLLTNAHVWSEAEPWPAADLPAERELTLLEAGGQVRASFRLVATGAGAEPPADDWVLLATDAALWEPERHASVHPSASDPGWTPPEGSALVVAGFSSIFFEGVRPAVDEPEEPEPVAWESFAPFLERGPYAITGAAERVEGRPAVRYPPGWPPPKGQSGGGVYLRDAASGALQLVGLFGSWAPTRVEVTQHVAPLGLSALSFERTSEEEGGLLLFIPIAPVLRAWDAERP